MTCAQRVEIVTPRVSLRENRHQSIKYFPKPLHGVRRRAQKCVYTEKLRGDVKYRPLRKKRAWMGRNLKKKCHTGVIMGYPRERSRKPVLRE